MEEKKVGAMSLKEFINQFLIAERGEYNKTGSPICSILPVCVGIKFQKNAVLDKKENSEHRTTSLQ